MKPDDIPQDVWSKAWNVEVIADFSFDGQTGGNREQAEAAENIARAIMAAVAEEREAILDAGDIYMREQYGYGALGNPVDRGRIIAIRNRSNT